MSDPAEEIAALAGNAAPEPQPKAAATQKAASETRPGELKWDEENAAEALIPDGLPVYKNVTPKGGTRNGRMFVFEWDTPDDKKKVMDYYREQLPTLGFKIENEESYGSFEATNGIQKLSVWIGSPPNKPTNILVRLYFKGK